MKSFMYNKDGAVYTSIVFVLLIIFVLIASLLNILAGNSIIINSNNDSYRADYIVESVLELKINEIMELCTETVDNYLADLQKYDTEYMENDDCNFLYSPPDLYNYITSLIPDVEKLSETVDNPFEEYSGKHSYGVDIKCNLNQNSISIVSKGEYNRARKFVKVEMRLPTIIHEDFDENGLPETTVLPAEVTKRYQTFGL